MSVKIPRLTFLSYKEWQILSFMAFGTIFANGLMTTRVSIL